MLINAGIREIIYEGGYGDELSREMLMEAKIRLRQIPAKQTRFEKVRLRRWIPVVPLVFFSFSEPGA